MKKYRKYDFEGTVINVLSEFDEHSGLYFDDIPDLEENPIYTPSGKLIVSAVQDGCSYFSSEEEQTDCGSCSFYQPNNPGDLIGLCTNIKMEMKKRG